jgi:AraC-like DNA-binding protein
MSTFDLVRKLGGLLASARPDRVTPVPHCGVVCCLQKHRLHHISLVQPAAILVLEGVKTLFRAEERLSVEAGRMFVLPSQMEVGIESDPDPKTGRYLALRLSFPEAMLARVLAGRGVAQGQVSATSLDAFLVAMDAPLAVVVGHLLDLAGTCPDNERLLSLYLEAVLVLLAERTPAAPLLWDRAAAWRSRVACLVGQDPARDWSGRELAGRLATSERSLRRFLEAEGTSLRRIFMEVRLGAALALLQSGRISVGEAAYRCGYNSASRFAVRFKEHFGASPSDILRFGAVLGQPLAEEERSGPRAAC